jgi:indolepyruvate ferredoxin oxidoreductase beta subunit
MNTSIMIVGVGGQGTLLASRILGNVAIKCGYDVKVSEVHGMSQRGGSVVTYVKYGERVDSPVICKGEADFLLSFELCEAARWLPYLKKDGIVVTSTQEIMPMPVITGQADYPANVYGRLEELNKNIVVIDALNKAGEAGNTKAVNVVMIGALCALIGISYEVAEKAIERCVPARLLEINIKALKLGYEA